MSRTLSQQEAALVPLEYAKNVWRYCAASVLCLFDDDDAKAVWRLVPPPIGTTCGLVLVVLLRHRQGDIMARMLGVVCSRQAFRSQLPLPLRTPACPPPHPPPWRRSWTKLMR